MLLRPASATGCTLASGTCNYPYLYACRTCLLDGACQLIPGMPCGHDVVYYRDVQCFQRAAYRKGITQVEPPGVGTQ
jgi:hypothetical protein